MHCHHNPCPPAKPVIAPTSRVVRDYYHPQVVPVIHPIEVVNRHHCVPVPCHYYTYSERDEVAGAANYPSKSKGIGRY
ncbi:CotD family spore coat protein [Paenibacillus sp. SAFN-117]|uniref:CotD family spore coat protein n=1 Tax=Paenibacillus sp. 32O-W TaxID=1695218 RepID=UPI0011A73CDA|nr:CotD family spore coat protein [Paenibacillus sp. 32O-W]